MFLDTERREAATIQLIATNDYNKEQSNLDEVNQSHEEPAFERIPLENQAISAYPATDKEEEVRSKRMDQNLHRRQARALAQGSDDLRCPGSLTLARDS